MSWLAIFLFSIPSFALVVVQYLLGRERRKNTELEQKLENHLVKEEADALRAEPVVHDKSAILGRM